MGATQLVLAKAAEAFTRGEYDRARQYYKQASARYGEDLFAQSIALCDRRLQQTETDDVHAAKSHSGEFTNQLHGTASESAIARQLQETQALLEKYYVRSQELEHKLLDREKEQKT